MKASTSLASAGVSATPAQGLQATVTSPVTSVVASLGSSGLHAAVSPPSASGLAGVLTGGLGAAQATLAGVGANAGALLAAPAVGPSTPTASVLRAVTGATAKKLKHG